MVRPHSRICSFGAALVVLAPLAAVVWLAAVPAPSAVAATPGSYLVTFVARQCPTYQDITANLARNNIQESLQDLGADTAYAAGQPISPSVETPNQPNCTALPGWQFTFGNGMNGTTPGTNLSRVLRPDQPQLDHPGIGPAPRQMSGNPTGSTIDGSGHHHLDRRPGERRRPAPTLGAGWHYHPIHWERPRSAPATPSAPSGAPSTTSTETTSSGSASPRARATSSATTTRAPRATPPGDDDHLEGPHQCGGGHAQLPVHRDRFLQPGPDVRRTGGPERVVRP